MYFSNDSSRLSRRRSSRDRNVCFTLFYGTFLFTTTFCYNAINKVDGWSLADASAAALSAPGHQQIELRFTIAENTPIGTLIGVIRPPDSATNPIQPPYLIVPIPGEPSFAANASTIFYPSRYDSRTSNQRGVETDLNIDETTGEIRNKAVFDHEQLNYYSFIAIPISGVNIRVVIDVSDANDNRPRFPVAFIHLEFPENSKPREVKRTLPPAKDFDLGKFGTQVYRIVSGNADEAFRLVSHREKDEVLYLDLQVNGTLDRETVANYTLVIEALDGGSPPLRGELTVNITILDVNDNEPIFSQTTYYGAIAENATLGMSLLQVTATDADEAENGLVTYSLHSRVPSVGSSAANSLTHFGINKNTGWIFVARPLDFESRVIHELVVIAKDSGAQPLETSAFVSISITDVNDNQPSISLLFLTESAKPEIPENAKIGDLVARISVNDPDNRDSGAIASDGLNPSSLSSTTTGFDVQLSGNDGEFGLTTQDTIVYLIVVTGPLNRALKSRYTLTITATDQGSPPLNATTFFNLEIVDSRRVHKQSFSSVDMPKVDEKSFEKSTSSPRSTSAVGQSLPNSLFTIDPFSILRNDSPLEIEYETSVNLSSSKTKKKTSLSSADPVEFDVIESANVGTEIGSIIVQMDAKGSQAFDCLNGYFVDYLTPNDRNDDSDNRHDENRFATEFPFLIESNDRSNVNIILAKRLDYETCNEYKLTIYADTAQCTLLVSTAEARSQLESHSNYQVVSKAKIYVEDDVSDCHPFEAVGKDVLENDIAMLEIEVPLSESVTPHPIDVYSLSDLASAGCGQLRLSYKLRSPLVATSVLQQLFAVNERGTLQLLIFNRHLVDDLLLQMELIVVIKAFLHTDNRENVDKGSGGAFLASVAVKVKFVKDEQRTIDDIRFLNPPLYSFDEDCCLRDENVIQFKINVSDRHFAVRYHLDDQLRNDHFLLDEETGLLSIRSPFDYETRHEFKLNVTASVYSRGLTGSTRNTAPGGGSGAASSSAMAKRTSTSAATIIKQISHSFTIKINNVNDERPIFAKTIYSTEALESLPPDTALMRLEAHDFDSNSNLTFLIPDGHKAKEYFAIHSRTGLLTTRAPLDREMCSLHHIPVYVFDDGYKHHDLTVVTVDLIDINDNPPLFSNPNQVIRLPENVKPGTVFYTVVAYDKDLIVDNTMSKSNDTQLKYRIIAGNSGKQFAIDEKLGKLTSVTPLDRERVDTYYLIVEVSDSRFNSTCNLTIELLDVNDNEPIFEQSVYYALIDENNLQANGDIVNVISVKAIDPDFKDKIYYTINGTETPEAIYFNIDSSSGLITTTPAALSHAKKAKTADGDAFGAGTDTAVVSRYSHPKLTNFTFNVFAVDIGIGSYVTHTSKALVHVTVVSDRRLENPKFKSFPYVFDLFGSKEDFKIGSQIGTVLFDCHSDDVTIQVIGEHPALRFSDYFNINSKTGVITVKRTLVSNYFECHLQAQRSEGAVIASSASLLQIFIGKDSFASSLDAKTKRIKSFAYKVELYENVPRGTELINLVSKSRQSALDARYKFEFAYTSVDQSYFHLNPNNGIISVKKVLDYETDPCLIELVIVAKKYRFSFDNPFYFNVSLSLLNINDNAPQFTQNHYVATVKEGESRGSFVAQISALDIDSSSNLTTDRNAHGKRRNTLTYHILEGNHDNAFIIDPPGCGIVKTNIVLDREIHDFYQLKIVASDEGAAYDARDGRSFGSNLHLTSYCTLEINVLDINDNVPVFPPYQEISVKEDAEIGSVISTLTANDVDTFPPLTYVKQRLLKTGDSDDIFDIGLYTGKITLKSALNGFDREVKPKSYKLNIFASDSLHSAETQVLVKIKRNKNAFFANGSFFLQLNPADDDNCLSESTSSSSECHLLDVSSSIFDESNNYSHNHLKICYLLSGKHSEHFSIDRFKGIISNNRSLIASDGRLYQLTVSAHYCRDNGRVVSEEMDRCSVVIAVEGQKRDTSTRALPDRRQQLSRSALSVQVMRENVGEVLMNLTDSRYKYAISDGNFGNVFAMKGGNQLILVKKATRSEYKLTITRIKRGTSSLTIADLNRDRDMTIAVNVRVLGMNKESVSPAFRFKAFNVRIKESLSVGEDVIRVKSDDSQTADYRYTIYSGNEFAKFHIDSTSGVIAVNNTLDHERRNFYQLAILAVNRNGSDAGLAIVNVIVVNVNNNVPKFPLTQYKAVVDENVPIGSKVIKVDAYDDDRSEINYTLIRTIDGLAPFVLDPKSGYLVTSENIDYESFKGDLPLYKLVLKAFDSFGGKSSSTEVLVEIQVASKDEFPPKFTIESYDFKVATSYGLPTIKVGQVSASDADLGPDGVVIYSLRSSSPANALKKFTVNSTTGLITINALSKEHIPPKYTSLIVSASSGRADSLSSLAVVEVTIHIIDDLKGVTFDDSENFIASSAAANPLPTALPGWTLFLIVFLMIITVVLLVSIIVIRLHQQQHQSMSSGLSSVHSFVPGVSTLLRKISRNNNAINPVSDTAYGQHPSGAAPHHHHHHHVQYLVSPSTLPPCYSEVTTTAGAGEGHSASSGRGSAEDEVEEDMDEADEEIRMIIEGNDYYEQCDTSVPTTAEYLARLGVIDRDDDDEEDDDEPDDDDDIDGELNIPIDDVHSDPGEMKLRPSKLFSSVRSQRPRQAADEWSKLDRSLNSIGQSDEDMNGAYNWNYLQDWGPKYQPLSSVFAEIAKLKGGLNLSDGQFDNNLNKLETASTISSSTVGSSHSHYRKNVSDVILGTQPVARPRQTLLPPDLDLISKNVQKSSPSSSANFRPVNVDLQLIENNLNKIETGSTISATTAVSAVSSHRSSQYNRRSQLRSSPPPRPSAFKPFPSKSSDIAKS